MTDKVEAIARELHMEHGCNGSLSCMFPMDVYSWCTLPLASRLAEAS